MADRTLEEVAVLTEGLEKRVNTLTNLSTTLIDCVATLAKAQVDPEVRLDIVTKLGSFVMTERDLGAE